jgi:chromate transport protein ChrA
MRLEFTVCNEHRSWSNAAFLNLHWNLVSFGGGEAHVPFFEGFYFFFVLFLSRRMLDKQDFHMVPRR